MGRNSKTWLFVREPLQRNHFLRFKVKRLVRALRSHNSFHNSCLQQRIVQSATKQSLSMQDSQASSLHLRTFTCHLPIFQAGSPTISLPFVVDNFYSRPACPGTFMCFFLGGGGGGRGGHAKTKQRTYNKNFMTVVAECNDRHNHFLCKTPSYLPFTCERSHVTCQFSKLALRLFPFTSLTTSTADMLAQVL